MFVNSKISFEMVKRVDREGNIFYLVAPDVPCFVDLSQIAILVFPFTGPEEGARMILQLALPGKSGPEIVLAKSKEEGNDGEDYDVEERKRGKRFQRG